MTAIDHDLRASDAADGHAQLVFDPGACRIVAADAAALALFGENSLFALAERSFAPDDPFLEFARGVAQSGLAQTREIRLADAPERGAFLCTLTPTFHDAGGYRLRGTLVPLAAPAPARDPRDSLEDALQALPAAVLMSTVEGRIHLSNAAADALLGTAGQTLAERLGDAAARTIATLFQRSPHLSRAVSIGLDPARRCHVEGRRLGGSAGGPIVDLLVFRDLTGLVAVEAGLAAERQGLTALLETAADFSWESGPDHRITHVSATFAPVTGLPREALLRQALSARGDRLMPEEGAEALFATAPTTFRDLAVALASTGREAIDLRLSGRAQRAGDGTFLGYRGVGRVLRGGDPAASSSTAKLAALIDATADGLIIADRDGRIGFANAAAARLLGAGREALTGRRMAALIAPEARDRLALSLAAGAREGAGALLADGTESLVVRADGTMRPVLLAVRPLGRGGAFQLCFVLRDLAPFKESAADLERAKIAAEEANRQKTEFLAKVSHEIRTPLNAIIGFTEIMRDEQLGPIGNARYKGYLNDIHHSGQLLLSLINDLLDLSKIESGRQALRFGPVDVAELVEQCVSLMEPAAAQAGLTLEGRASPGLPAVMADERSLEQVVLNLLSNAVKFTKAGGHVRVEAGAAADGGVVITVRDTGIGMSDADLKVALEPFRRVERPDVLAKPGTGLGLPLAKALVEANRAAFRIASEPRAGTAIEIRFPVAHVVTGAT